MLNRADSVNFTVMPFADAGLATPEPTRRSMAIYKSDMLEFGYDATLHVQHPNMAMDVVGPSLGLVPKRIHAAGDARTTPAGNELPEKYSQHYCSFDLETVDQQDITDFLRRLITDFEPNRELLLSISDSGGEVCVFIGVGCSRCCAHQFARQLLWDLASMGLDLRIDFYGTELPQRNLHPNARNTA